MAKGRNRSKKKSKKPKKRWRTRTWVVGRRELTVRVAGARGVAVLRLVLERPSGLIVAYAADEPGDSGSLTELLLEAADVPMAGPPRLPDRVVTPDTDQLEELRRALEEAGLGAIPVVVADAPDLARLLDSLALDFVPEGTLVREEPPPLSYFDEGVDRDSVAELFAAAAELYRRAPWEWLEAEELLRLDCPALGFEDACALIIGQERDSYGLLIFPSLDGYRAFTRASEARMAGGSFADGIGSSLLALNFERAADLPLEMRKEAAKHGWPLAGPRAYPWIQHRDEDADLLPTRPEDVRAVTVAARAMATYVDGMADPAADPAQRITVGEHTVLIEPFPQRAPTVHDRERVLAAAIMTTASERFGKTLDDAVARCFPDPDEALMFGLAVPWIAYQLELGGRRLADWFLEALPGMSDDAKAHLEAQRRAWFSAWEVTAAVPGETLTLRDHLTGEERIVHDVGASTSTPVRSTIFARVLDLDGRSYLAGVHQRFLGPAAADLVVAELRKYLRRKKPVPPERLRDSKTSLALILIWGDAIELDDERRAQVPTLQNTDGDPLLLTEDRFTVDPKNLDALRERIEAIEGSMPGKDDDSWALSRPGNAMHASWDNTIVAHLELAGGTLRVHTNSLRRADEARTALERTLGDLIRFQTRTHADPTSAPSLMAMSGAKRGEHPPHPNDPEKTPEILEALRTFKTQHYADWPDHPLPALGGKTPRQAARTKKGKQQVDQLLREMEHHEQMSPPAERFDFGPMRKELGL